MFCSLEGVGRTATEHKAGDTACHRPPRDGRVPGEQTERAAIVRQHVGAELMVAALLSRMKDLLEEERAQAKSLPVVHHDETDVSCPFVGNAVSRHSTLAKACASSGRSRRKEKNRWYSVCELNLRHSAIRRNSSSGRIARTRTQAPLRRITPCSGPARSRGISTAMPRLFQARAFTTLCSTALGAAPRTRSTTAPCLKNRIVGIDWIP